MSYLKQLGFSESYLETCKKIGANKTIARVIEQQKGLLKLDGQQGELRGEWWAEISGKLYHEARGAEDLPVVGDWVLATSGGFQDRLQIQSLLPRQSLIKRRAIGSENDAQLLAANVDHIFIVTSLNQDLRLNRLDRYRALAEQSGVAATLVLSKSDLASEETYQGEVLQALAQQDLPFLRVSSLSHEGLKELESRLEAARTYVFIGSSGVGKSTLINTLLGEERQSTSDVRISDDRGRHTTSSRSLLRLPRGALLLDTPGMRELGLWQASESVLEDSFEGLSSLARQCRYRDCQHESEDGCAVRAAIAQGAIDPARLASYRKLQKERAYDERKQDKRKMIEAKQRWKTIHKAARRSRKDF